MTKLLDKAIEAAKELPAEMQDDIARVVLTFAGNDEPVYELTPEEEEADLAKSLAEASRREFAAEEQVEPMWAKYR